MSAASLSAFSPLKDTFCLLQVIPGVISGTGNGKYCQPQGEADRTQAAVMLRRLFEQNMQMPTGCRFSLDKAVPVC